MKKAVFPGSFDPITIGHEDIIRRGLDLFDEIVVAVGVNADKRYQFSLEERLAFIQATFKDDPKIKVTTYQGLTVDYCKQINADFILRGLRNPQTSSLKKRLLIPIEHSLKLKRYFFNRLK
jgi:pantetheine-phosphate adenylyltransferase